MAAAFAMADARCDLIDSLKDEAIRAKLLRMTDPEIAMVELANNPTDEDRIRICAIGILSGFTPGNDEFAVFGAGFDKRANKPKPGKLYIKERGFRTLFSHLGIVPECRTGHPEWLPYGDAGKKMWAVTGSASCTYQGEDYDVQFDVESPLRIDGYDSDNTAGITAKCRRRLLQSLWVKVSPILTSDYVDDESEPVVSNAATIAVTAPLTRHAETEKTIAAPAAEPIPFADQIEAATKSRDLDTIARAIKAANLPDDEFAFYKAMVTEARRRLTEAEVAT